MEFFLSHQNYDFFLNFLILFNLDIAVFLLLMVSLAFLTPTPSTLPLSPFKKNKCGFSERSVFAVHVPHPRT